MNIETIEEAILFLVMLAGVFMVGKLIWLLLEKILHVHL